MYCNNCGNKIDTNGNFCNSCGSTVNNSNQSMMNQNINQQTMNQPYNNFNYNYNTNQTNMNTKKKNNSLAIVAALFGFIIFIFFASIIVKSAFTFLNNSTSELKLHDLKIEYPFGWENENNTNSNTESITKGGVRVALLYTKSNVYYSSYSAASELVQEYESGWDSFSTIEGIKAVTINGVEWQRFEFEGIYKGESRKGIQIVYSTDYEIYTIIYVAKDSNYDTYLESANTILASATIATKPINKDSTKQQILGEWDCGNTGYLVINNDNTYYFYKDSSKSSNNVIYGTYEVSDGIATNAAGYANGVTFIGTIKQYTVDGENISTVIGNKIQYAFSPSDNGNFIGTNISIGSTFTMTKVK